MNRDVQEFCRTCTICKASKPNNYPPYGLLQTLEVPTRPWEMIGIDFVGPLPESENLNGKFDMLLVIIDHLTSMVHLAPTKQTYRAKDIAEVLFDRVYKHHGMPAHIVSDRDSLFTSTFWKTLHELTGIELRMSSSFHPQTDGATECANRTVTQMLRQCVEPHQRDWVTKLPAIEFAMNSATSSTTGYAPFFLNYGRMPPSMIFETNSEYPGVKNFVEQTKAAIMDAHDSIISARFKQTELSNKKRKESPFVKGDMVYLSTANLTLPKGRAHKLPPKFIGPYKILEDYKNNTYLLDVPAELKQRGIHPAFHANLLRIHEPTDYRRFPGRQLPQLIGIGKVEEWSIDKIDDHHSKGKDALFELVYKTGDKFWLPYHEVSKLEAMTQYLELIGVKKIKDLPKKVSKVPEIIVSNIEHRPGRNRMVNAKIRSQGQVVLNTIDKFIREMVQERSKGIKSKGRTKKTFHPSSMSQHIYNDEDLRSFCAFANAIQRGEKMPKSFGYPLGYLDYCIKHQHDPDVSKRLPFPPGAPI